MFAKAENVLLAVQDEECRCKLRSFRGYASQLYAKVDIHVIKSRQASPLHFCTLIAKAEWCEVLGMRLGSCTRGTHMAVIL